ncbi:molybdenum cofactor guanylyltransferase [Neobacillus niacini]|uniref:molybdenum cofactor guanylyltransferase n=1 Tax=Neobacillus niacini TaxID=86668 RepID=UPI002862F8B5|nr:molybdenum cofactor guanylyltransferase [Neobacillus niacini]MDR6999426.1 molybdopterin-guanine dinucleotide biosynthesis protein A [Neobacillus niacini]
MKAAAIILSGGKSSRMGTNKALLKINEKTNIERLAEELKGYFAEIILVTNHPDEYRFLGVKMVSDQFPGLGPIAGLHAGLRASNHEVNIVVACDMPFVSGVLAKKITAKVDGSDAVIPIIDGKKQPLFAAYHRRILPVVEESIEKGNLRMTQLLDDLHVLYLTPEDLPGYSRSILERSFFNMNYLDEYEKAKKWAEQGD